MSDDLIKALQKEAREDAEIITRLRAENERLRRLGERIVEHHEQDESEVSGWTQWEALVKDARAAIEGVTEKSGAENE